MTDNPQVSALVALAERQLAAGQAQEAATCLTAALELDPAHLAAHNLRERHRLPGCFSDWMGVACEISPDDDIFGFFARHPSSRNPVRDYLADGWRTALELHGLMDRLDASIRRSEAFLEFACGHGRFTRHLVHQVPAGALSVSDVVPGSVDFLRGLLGVKGFDSVAQPEQLVLPERYQHVFVLSLFSHLPDATWGAWLRTLSDAVRPGGMLVFSTHGMKCVQQSKVELSADGFAFFASSESTAIDAQAYGTTFTSPAYVERTVRRVLGPSVGLAIVPNVFWGNQDAVVIRP